MTNQMSSMNAWDKEEMDGNILDEGNAMSQIRHQLFTTLQKNQTKEVRVVYFKTTNFVSKAVIKKLPHAFY